MKDRQRRFADEYLIDLNAEAAAVRAGYSPRYARGNAYKLVARSGIKEYIEKRMAEKESELIADQNEVLRYLTAVMRGESTSEEIIVEGIGDGRSKARKLEKTLQRICCSYGSRPKHIFTKWPRDTADMLKWMI